MEEGGLVEGDWNDPLDSRGGGGCAGENEQKFAATKTQIEQVRASHVCMYVCMYVCINTWE